MSRCSMYLNCATGVNHTNVATGLLQTSFQLPYFLFLFAGTPAGNTFSSVDGEEISQPLIVQGIKYILQNSHCLSVYVW